MITALDIVRARQRISRFLAPTPLRYSTWLSAATQARVYLKLECAQLTSAFKIRGAFNAILCVLERNANESSRLVTASAGNHGRALALVAEQLGLRAVIFTPRDAPATKKAAIRQHGATLHDEPVDYDAAERAAREYAAAQGALFVSPYNDVEVIAGAATVALEILDVLPTVDALVVPIGGGGLLSGVGLAAKACVPRARVIGVETAASTPFAASLGAGRIVEIDPQPSLADGLTGNLEPGSITFELVRSVIDQLTAVDESQIENAIRALAAEEHVIAEGAGAVATAAVLSREVVRAGETAVVLVTGGNIDVKKLAAILHSG